jgi:hypothetical protein
VMLGRTGKHGLALRRGALRQQALVLRDNPGLTGFFLGGYVVVVAVFLVGDYLQGPGVSPVTAFALGAVTVGALWLAWWLTLLVAGTFSSWAGGIGEFWTGETLDPLRKKGWRTISNVFLGDSDVDLILVGPGGVLAVETKWTSERWNAMAGARSKWFEQAIGQAQQSAKRLSALLRQREFGVEVPVVPILMLWGPGAVPIEGGFREIDGVAVLVGAQSDAWFAALDRSPQRIENWQVAAVSEGLQAYRDEQERRRK